MYRSERERGRMYSNRERRRMQRSADIVKDVEARR